MCVVRYGTSRSHVKKLADADGGYVWERGGGGGQRASEDVQSPWLIPTADIMTIRE